MEQTSRVVSLYIPYHSNPAVKQQNYIIYRGDKINLSDSDREELVNLLPEYWHTDKDKLTHFVISADGSYYCERIREFYNFATKQAEERIYEFDTASVENVESIRDIIFSFYESRKLKNITDLQKHFVERLQNFNFFKSHLLGMRQAFLKESDYMFLSDYPHPDEETKQKWGLFRQELRDLTDQEAWKEDDYLNVSFPVSPREKDQVRMMIDIATQSGLTSGLDCVDSSFNADFIKDYGKVLVKIRIIDALSGLGLPSIRQMLGVNLPEFGLDGTKSMNFDSEFAGNDITAENISVAMTQMEIADLVNKYANEINDIIQKLDPTMSIGKVWEIAEDMLKYEDKDEITEEVMELLDSLNNDTPEGENTND